MQLKANLQVACFGNNPTVDAVIRTCWNLIEATVKVMELNDDNKNNRWIKECIDQRGQNDFIKILCLSKVSWLGNDCPDVLTYLAHRCQASICICHGKQGIKSAYFHFQTSKQNDVFFL